MGNVEIKFIDIKQESFKEDVLNLKICMKELKQSIKDLDSWKDEEVYHRYCDLEDEINNLLDTIEGSKVYE